MTTSLYSIPIEKIKGITKTNLPKFKENLGIHNLGELVMYLPRNYEDRTQEFTLAEVTPGNKVCVKILVIGKYKKEISRNNVRLIVNGVDINGDTVLITYFSSANWYDQKLEVNQVYSLFGIVENNLYGQTGFKINHPEILEQDLDSKGKSLTPIYPSTSGLKQDTIRKVINNGLSMLEQLEIPELLPANGYPPIPYCSSPGAPLDYLDINKLSFKESLLKIHHPPVGTSSQDIINRSNPWIVRLISEEILARQLSLIEAKNILRKLPCAKIAANSSLVQKIIADLPYKLTDAQLRAYRDVEKDLASGNAMLRLIQGDVGCGKTMVALLSLAHVVEAGYQAACIAPTEILALQLYDNIKNALVPYGIKVGFVSGRLGVKAKRLVNEDIKAGNVQVVVGTHAVFSEWVEFKNLALAVIDEQHRFGVQQRLEINAKQKEFKIHTLMMSATPAPRSIAMTLYADLDLSIIDELPPGRMPVETFMLSNKRRHELINRIRYVINYENRQVYWVCVLIEENENYNAHSAIQALELMRTQMPEVRIGLIHGRMKDQEKEEVMLAFKNHELDMLIATTVIEVGVNVPNASIMIIENPERLGLSQIHQLRGRVGRGSIDSSCGLLYDESISQSTKNRLQIFKQTNDGFVIAEEDMKLRGSGDIVGTAQSGEVQFMLSDLAKDHLIAQTISAFAENLYYNEPELAAKLINRWDANKQQYLLA
ncbi:ATP-dependent DNA helicase RecG [Psittacicella hinzii]|nr:ATP-dependent DNA helicase RecG [Psittacicella hinzii]